MIRAIASKVYLSRLVVGLSLAFMGAMGYECYDGARDRLHQRYEQVQAEVGPRAEKTVDVTERTADRVWTAAEQHQATIVIALLTVLVTIVYHKANGKSLRQAVEIAATRVHTVPTAVPVSREPDPTTAIGRAGLKVLADQLEVDRDRLENAAKNMPMRLETARKNLKKAKSEHDESLAVLGRRTAAAKDAEVQLGNLLAEQEKVTRDLQQVRSELGGLKSKLA